MEKRVTRSNSNTRRDPEETEGAFWGRVIDPVTIEKGQAEAIRTVRHATSGDPTALLNTTQNEQHEEDRYQSQPSNDNQGIVSLLDEDVPNNLLEDEMPFTSNLTNYTEQSSQILQAMRTAFVNNTPSTTEEVETVTINMNISGMNGPLDPMFTRPSSRRKEDTDLDKQPMRGPREVNTTSDTLDHFMDDNYGDVLRSSLLNPSSYVSLPLMKTPPSQPQPGIILMDWYVPDGTNRLIVEIPEREIADFRSPGGGTGALILILTRLLLHFNTTKYLVDIDTGEVFGWIANQWHRTGLYCSPQPFVMSELSMLTTRCSAALKMDLEQEEQTTVLQLPRTRRENTVMLPPLPLMPEPEAYVQQLDAMTPNMRRNYVRDRMQAALTYIKEYELAQQWEGNPEYDRQEVLQRLQLIYGKADKVRQQIDTALNNDDMYRRRRVMRPLGLPQRFPEPQSMRNCATSTWITWIREESNDLITAIDEEKSKMRDPDDPFNGTAGGIFGPLQHEEEQEVHQQQHTSGHQRYHNELQTDESDNRNAQNERAREDRMTDVFNVNPQQQSIPERAKIAKTAQETTPRSQRPPRPPSERQPDTSSSRPFGCTHTGGEETERNTNRLQMNMTTDRRVEESRDQGTSFVQIQRENEQTEQTEDLFRSVRSFHEKQRKEKLEKDRQLSSVSSQSTPEGAVGGAKENYPKPQRMNARMRPTDVLDINQKQVPHKFRKEQETPHPDSYLREKHNSTAYMNLPNSIQNKVCGRCGLVGHIKKQCREEVYCKFCKNSSHSIRACRTYANFLRMDPVTSSRKNTPEKRTTEDIDREITMRVEQEMRRLLTDLGTSRQVGQANHQQIPMRSTRAHNLIGDYQRPPETLEEVTNNPSGRNMVSQPQEMCSTLNKRWEEPPHMQAQMAPMYVDNKSNTYQKTESSYPGVNAPTSSTTVRDRQVDNNCLGVHPMQSNEVNNRNQGNGTLSTSTTTRGVDQPIFNRQRLDNRKQGDVNTDHSKNRHVYDINSHTMQSKIIHDVKRNERKTEDSYGGEVGINRTPSNNFQDDIFTNLVKDSVSAHGREGIRPMFVNNYYVGDNSWRPETAEKDNKKLQGVDTSTNRSHTAVQTAISSLGDDDKTENYMQTGISRIKAMGSNVEAFNKQSSLVVEPGKNSNLTGWSTNSYNLPDLQLNTSNQRQQCKGLPDLTVPPPTVQPPPAVVQIPQGGHQQATSQRLEENLMRVIETMEQQMRLNTTKSEYNMTQNTRMMDQLIKAQDRRDLDPALMDIPTFSGDQPEKCLEWVTRIRNVCRQSGRSFRQELTNKSGLVVQNFLATMDTDMADSELVEKILQMFSDIPTTTQAIAKLKALRQGENETILAYNQRYRILVERVEGRTIEQITSPVAMEMYLGTIIPPLRKSIKNSLFWNSKHAPRTVGEAMSKAQQLYVKHLYATGYEQEDEHTKVGEEVVINEISRKFENRYRDRRSDFRDSSRNRRDNYSQQANTYETRWKSYDNAPNSHHSRYQEKNNNQFAGEPATMDVPTSRQQNDKFGHITRQEDTSSPSHRTVDKDDGDDISTNRQNRQESTQNSVLRGSYTQILVNPMQLTDIEFTNWMEKLVEARKNRQEKRPRPYRKFRKPYNDSSAELKKPTLKNRLQPAQELDVQTIMSSFNCEYDDVVEAVDLYNLDVDESRTA